MELTHHGPDAPLCDVVAHLRTHGYAIIDDLAPSSVMDAFADEVRPFLDAVRAGGDDYNGRFTRRVGSLIARCPAARALVMDPTVVAVVRAFLDHATAVQLHLTQLIAIAPGETRQKLHRDQMAFDYFAFPSDYHAQCNTMWALTDFTTGNGATHVVPGTSAVSDAEAELMAGAQAEMRRGSVLFYDGKVLHGGGANVSDHERMGINITYSVGWVRQEENQFVSCPPEIARTLDDDLLRLMGYQQGAYALGYVGDLQDPLAALRGEHGDALLIAETPNRSAAHREFVSDLERLEAHQSN